MPRPHMDYAILQECIVEMEDESQSSTSASVSVTMLVTIETLCESAWAYSVHASGVLSDAWFLGKIENDLATVVVDRRRVVINTDTESALSTCVGQWERFEVARRQGTTIRELETLTATQRLSGRSGKSRVSSAR